MNSGARKKMNDFCEEKRKMHGKFFEKLSKTVNKSEVFLKKIPKALDFPEKKEKFLLPTLTTKPKKRDFFTFDQKSIEFLSKTKNTESSLQLYSESRNTEQENSVFSRLLTEEPEFLNKNKSFERLSSVDNAVERKIKEIYPAFDKYSMKNIDFLRDYSENLKKKAEKRESETTINVKEKIQQLGCKSIAEKIQLMRKLFNFYAIKKKDLGDISKENIKASFSLYENCENLNANMNEELYNFKLSKEMYEKLEFKKEKILDIDDILVESPVIQRKKNKIQWLIARQDNRKKFYSMKFQEDNHVKIARKPYCE